MAQLETWYKQDLKKPLVVHRHADVFNQDSRGNLIGVEIYSDGEPVTLTGSIDGYCLLADGTTVSAVGANRTGNKASILIPQTAYNVPGPITITIKNTDGNDITTLCAVVGLVRQSVSGNLVQPGDIVTDWSQSINSQLQAVQDAADNVGAIVAAPFAENTAYVVGNYVTYNGNLYRITADHAAGVTWANTAKTQCTVGAEFYDLKSAMDQDELFEAKHGNPNLINPMRIVNEMIAASSVSVTWNGTKITFAGTAAGNGIYHAYLNATVLPIGMKAGEIYHLKYHGTLVKCYVYYYVSGSSSAIELIQTFEDIDFELPATAVGLNIRLRVAKNSVLNETVEAPFIYSSNNASIAIREDINNLYRTTTAGMCVGMYHKNMIPSFTYNGKTVTVTVPEKGSLRCVDTNSKSITTSGNLEGDYDVTINNALIFNVTSKALSIKPIAELADDDIVLIYNSSNGGIIGQWAQYYYMVKIANDKIIEPKLIPEYYDNHLSTKITAINTIAATLPKASGRMFFVTDYHLGVDTNANMSPVLVNELINQTGISNVVFGGDAYEKGNTPDKAQNRLFRFLDMWRPIEDRANVFYITGNHEYNRPAGDKQKGGEYVDPPENALTERTVWNAYTGHTPPEIVRLAENSFYYDDDTAKVRYYFLDCDYKSSLDPDFLVRPAMFASLENVPDGFSVLVFSHIVWAGGVILNKINQICSVCVAMNEGRESEPIAGVTYDFTNKARPFIGVICGHSHSDGYAYYVDEATSKKFPLIRTTTDAYGKSGVTERVPGTVYEQAFDVVQLDTTEKIIYMTRIGWGDDRTFSYGGTDSDLIS